MNRTGGDLWLLHRGWHWHWITVIHGDSPATWHVGLHTGSTVANGVLPAYGCDQFWYWLHITQEFFKISHKQFGSGCARVCPWYRHRVLLTLHADDENVDSHMQWKRHDNFSAASGQYACENQNELQLCCTKCQAVTFQRPEDSRQLTDAACWCRSQTVPTENKTCLSVVSGWRETISKQKLSDYHASWGWQ